MRLLLPLSQWLHNIEIYQLFFSFLFLILSLCFSSKLNYCVFSSLPIALTWHLSTRFPSFSAHSEWPSLSSVLVKIIDMDEFIDLRLLGRIKHVFTSPSGFKSYQFSFESGRTWVTVLNVSYTSWDRQFSLKSHLAKDKKENIFCYFFSS